MDQDFKLKRTVNPRKDANILSVFTFAYLFPLFRKGRQKDLSEEDIPHVYDEYAASDLGNVLEKYWKNQILSNKPSLWKAVWHTFGMEFIMVGIGFLFDGVFLQLAQPVALSQLLRYFANGEDASITKNEAYLYAGIIVVTSIFSAITSQRCLDAGQLLGMKLRIACTSLVYKKCLKLNKAALGRMSIGHITNLLSNDLNRLNEFPKFFHFIWISPIQVLLMAGILYQLLGIVSIVGILLMAIIVPIDVLVGKKYSKCRLKVALKTDERIRLVSEVIAGIKVIKMYAWEKPFTKLMENIRRLEIREISRLNDCKIFGKFLLVIPKLAIFMAVGVVILTGGSITAVYVFTVACFYNILKLSFTIYFVNGINTYGETLISVERLQQFLLLDENNNAEPSQCRSLLSKHGSLRSNRIPLVELIEVQAKWCKSNTTMTLNGVNLKVEGAELVGIIGKVGSGKSSILYAILKELSLENGTINVHGRISYASQEPWIFGGSIQQNILFGKPMNNQRYKEVLKACALNQDLMLFTHGDQTFVGERGVMLSGGQKARINLARALYLDADIYLLDDPLSAVDVHVGEHVFEQCMKTFLKEKCTILVTHQVQYLQTFNHIILVEKGKISGSGTYLELKAKNKLQFIGNEMSTSDNKYVPVSNEIISTCDAFDNEPSISTAESRNVGAISKDTLITFVGAANSKVSCILFVAVFIFSQVTFTASDFFLAYWVIAEEEIDSDASYLSESDYVYIYTGLIISVMLSTIYRTYLFFNLCTKISFGLHQKMFAGVLNTFYRFFHINNSGRILNRFTKDMGVIDEELPVKIIDVFQIFSTVFGILILICIITPWSIISTVVICILVYCLRNLYVPTARSLVRLDGTARSPVLGHINETLQGLSTIRASNSQSILQNEFDKHQDLHTSIHSLFVNSTKAFGLYTDLCCILYLATTVFTILVSEFDYSTAIVGLAITQSLGLLGMLEWGILQLSESEMQFTSVERIVEYVNTDSEHISKDASLSDDWPQSGKIEFKSVSLKYGPDLSYALKNINFVIEPKKKIGVVGRTGAGKSSLISALFQLSKIEGAIIIDNIDIGSALLSGVRSKISIIPQDPFLFHETLKNNLDPFNEYTDLNLWNALEQVELKSKVSELPLGLDFVVSDGGSNFSVGQRQLICMARALLKHNKILVLDEATANVDPYTDTLIQNTIKENFMNCTVITIAHRLNTIMDSDKILVMEAGEVVEFDHPYLLLKNQNGVFYSMLQKTGTAMATFLTQIAEDSYSLQFGQSGNS